MESALSCGVNYNIEHYICTKEVFNTYSSITEDNGTITIKSDLYDGSIEFYDNFIDNNIIKDIYDLYNCIDNGEEIPDNLKKYLNENNEPLYNRLDDLYLRVIEEIDYFKDVKYRIKREFYSTNYTHEEASKFNYFCPPDVLNYCNNTSLLNINSLFEGTITNLIIDENMYGYRGRIPECIFSKINNVKTLKNVFNNLKNIMPYKNGYYMSNTSENGEINNVFYNGVMYPPMLFDNCKNLTSMRGLFRYNVIPGLCVIETRLFRDVSQNLTSINALFEYCEFISNGNSNILHLENGIFNSMSILQDASSLFSSTMNLCIPQDIFTQNIHSYLSDVSGFMLYSYLEYPMPVPEFWTWTSITDYEGCYKDLLINPTNFDNIPNSYK